MKCDKVKELLATDYMDGELTAEKKSKIDSHLKTCSSCRDFEQALRQVAIEPFRKTQKFKPSPMVWNRIKTGLGPKPAWSWNPVPVIMNALHFVFRTKKPAFALATIMTIIVIVFVVAKSPFNNDKAVNLYLEDQADFLYSLSNGISGYYNGTYMDLGTDIEEYFL